MLHIGSEFQYQIKDAAGNVVWMGACTVGCDYLVKNSGASTIVAATVSGEAVNTTDIPIEMAVIPDGPNTVVGTAWNPGTSDPLLHVLAGNAVASATPPGFFGIALERIKAASIGRVAGPGSIMAVKVTSGAIAAGAPIGGSATVGLCATMTTTTTTTYAVGNCVKAAAQQGALGVYYAGVLVCPH